MPSDDRIEQLLELLLSSDKTPQDLCAGEPELLHELQERWHHLTHVEAAIEALFPRSDDVGSSIVAKSRVASPTSLEIPGYEVTNVLGTGGMGIVYRGVQLKLDRVVAIKMLRADLLATPSLHAAALSREAQAIAALKHPNIVQVFDVGEVDGSTYFTMEYMDGGTLADELDGVPTSAAYAATTVVKISGAVAAAHRAGIVHRDLKPANVLLTADGTPKVSDFGIALRATRKDAGVTAQREARIGTPSYMAPEQADGRRGEVGPLSDVYALGAILYEMLTGRPPFCGESQAETELQLLTQEPVAPSRLNARVPRDLDTICLKCLQKDPTSRYESASALADDIERFQRNEPISARRVSTIERGVKWAQRHAAISTAAIAIAVLLASAFGVALWRASSRATANRAAEADAREAVLFLQQSDWVAAGRAIDRAAMRAAGNGSQGFRDQLAKARDALALAAQLEKIRLDGAISVNGELEVHRSTAGDAYAAAFEKAGLARKNEDPAIVAARLRASPISDALVAALDNWAFAGEGSIADPWLLSIVKQTHANPDGSADEVLRLALSGGPAECQAYLDKTPITRRSLPLLIATANKFAIHGDDALPTLIKLQAAFPNDYWTNALLGSYLTRAGKHPESLRFLQAAMVIRPDIAMPYNNLAGALVSTEKYDEAVVLYRKALEFDPDAPNVHSNLAAGYLKRGDTAAAEKEALRAANVPGRHQAVCLHTLAAVYVNQKRFDEALDASRRAVALAPTQTPIQQGLRRLLRRAGRQDDVFAAWRAAIAASPDDHEAYSGYAEYCLFVGRTEAYERARNELLEKFGDSRKPWECERASRACLLLPASSPEQLKRAEALVDRAIDTATKSPTYAGFMGYYKFAKGLACYRSGDFKLALQLTNESADVLRPAPQLVGAMARFRLGNEEAARAYLEAAIASRTWGNPSADGEEAPEEWIYRILRHEAETLIVPKR